MLAARDFPIGQIIFVVLALLGWIIKEIAERKQRERARVRRGARHDAGALVEDLPGRPASAARPPPLHDSGGGLEDRQLEGDLTAQGPAVVASQARRHPATWLRLGVRPGGRRASVRRAVLWSEVLGPPRALAGPHRPPAVRRAR